MSFDNVKGSLASNLYHIPWSPVQRDRPMKLLVLGLSRTGTDSLRSALTTLGYRGVYHGFHVACHPEDCVFWVSALEAKWNGKIISASDFDKVLGTFEALSDNPANCFGLELLAAYPDAKVVINRRRDLHAWHASCKASIFNTFENRFLVACSWFNARLFWLWRVHALSFGHRTKGDFDANGIRFAQDHYDELDAVIKSSGRSHLDWYVDDGWRPLCHYLGKDIPDVPFPTGNAAGKEFEAKVAEYIGGLIKKALLKMVGFLIVLVTIIAVLWRRWSWTKSSGRSLLGG